MSSSPLNYAPRPPMHRRRTFLKWLTPLVLLIIVACAREWGAPAWQRISLLYWQHRCMAYSPPPGQICFDPDLATPKIPREWSNFYSLFSPPGGRADATLFVHEMKTPKGEPRLVIVDLVQFQAGDFVMIPRVFIPGTAFNRPIDVTANIGTRISTAYPSPPLILAANLDANDPTHFTFRMTSNSKQQTWENWEGWLQDDNTIIIGQRK